MRKNVIRKTAKIIGLITLSASIFSCEKQKKTVCNITGIEQTDGINNKAYRITYDNINRVQKIITDNYELQFSYATDTTLIHKTFSDGTFTDTKAIYDPSGKIQNYTTVSSTAPSDIVTSKYFYNATGVLVKSIYTDKYHSDTKLYKTDSGNIAEITWDGDIYSSAKYSYYPNYYTQNAIRLNEMLWDGIAVFTNTNLIKSLDFINNSPLQNSLVYQTSTLTYAFNKAGQITEIQTATNLNGNLSNDTTHVSYECN